MSRINYRIFLASLLSFVFFFSFFQFSQAGFFDWFRKNDSQNSQSAATTVVSKAKNYTLSVSKSGSGIVTSDDLKINCGKQCKASYPANSKIALKAEAGNNYKFDRWNGCDKVADGKCQTTLNKSKMIVAKFVSKNASPSSPQKSSSLSSRKTSSSKVSSVSSKASSSKAFSSSLASKSSSSISSQQTQNSITSSSKSSGSSFSGGGLSSVSSSAILGDNQYFLKITSPNGGENWKKGSTQSIKFTTNKFDRFITLKLYKNNNYLLDIGYYDIANSNLSKNSENNYSWNVPNYLSDGEDYKIHATITNSKELYGYEISDWSDNVFAIKTESLAGLYKKGEIVVIEDNGILINSDKSIKQNNVTNRFYQSYGDDYDFLAIYPDFNSVLGGNYTISNQVNGIGVNKFDNTNQYGSKGRLKAISNTELPPMFLDEENYKNGVKYQDMYTLAHEIGHTWCCFIKNEPTLTTPNTSIRGHWLVSLGHFHSTEDEKKWLDTNSDIMGGGDFVDNQDGTFTMSSYSGISINQKKFFPFTLYLMGLISPESVPPANFIEFEFPVNSGKTTKGTKKEITINDIVKNNSKREPTYLNAQKDFNTAFILVTEKGKEPKTETMSRLTEIINKFPNYWAVATHCKSTMTTNLDRNNKAECQSDL